MSSVSEILKIGAEFGLDGKLLADFLRDERNAARESQKTTVELQEREKEREESERRRQDRDREREKERQENERRRQEREKERLHELEVLRLQQTAATIADQDNARQPAAAKYIKPKIPPFDDSKEEIDAYLHRFEHYATAQNWEKESWATSLSALLKGEALNVYYRLPVEDYDDYDAVKTALLKRYQLTEKGFREKFRQALPEHGETFSQFITRLDMYLQRWVELSGIEQTYDDFKDLLLREQALNVANKDLQVFLQERKPKDVKEMGILAEQYLEVHGKLYDAWKAQSKSLTKHPSDKQNKAKTKNEENAGANAGTKGTVHEDDKS